MDLRSGYPFWFIKNGLLNSYPSLSENVNCEVVIIGGGITGAICAYYLNIKGINTVVVDRRHIASGSTCASTALLQYEIDTPLNKLIKMTGTKNANTAYQLCLRSIDKIKKIIDKTGIRCDFEYKKSLYLASFKKDVAELEEEYKLRKKIQAFIRNIEKKG